MRFGSFIARPTRRRPHVAPAEQPQPELGAVLEPISSSLAMMNAPGNLKADFQRSLDEWLTAQAGMEQAQIRHFVAVCRMSKFSDTLAALSRAVPPNEAPQAEEVERTYALACYALRETHAAWRAAITGAIQKGRDMDDREKRLNAYEMRYPPRRMSPYG